MELQLIWPHSASKMFSQHRSGPKEAHSVSHTQTWIISRPPSIGAHDCSGHIRQLKEPVLPVPAL